MNKLEKQMILILISYLINCLFYFRFLSFTTSKNEVRTKSPDKLQLLP